MNICFLRSQMLFYMVVDSFVNSELCPRLFDAVRDHLMSEYYNQQIKPETFTKYVILITIGIQILKTWDILFELWYLISDVIRNWFNVIDDRVIIF